jgi:uncharacterized membrane protein YsdA (DUF1294 family)/cold shock CspA family protein
MRWDEAKGFGFIHSPASTADVFFHVRDFRAVAGQSPRQGQVVTFEEIHVGGKGPRAMAVQVAGAAGAPTAGMRRSNAGRERRPTRAHRSPPASTSGAWLALPLMLAYAAALAWAVWAQRLPWWVLAASPALNLLAFFAYWQDKFAAQRRQWRIKEDTLHIWSLAGGWAGAWFAQQVLRHKSSKPSFLVTYWLTTVLHCAALAACVWWIR